MNLGVLNIILKDVFKWTGKAVFIKLLKEYYLRNIQAFLTLKLKKQKLNNRFYTEIYFRIKDFFDKSNVFDFVDVKWLEEKNKRFAKKIFFIIVKFFKWVLIIEKYFIKNVKSYSKNSNKFSLFFRNFNSKKNKVEQINNHLLNFISEIFKLPPKIINSIDFFNENILGREKQYLLVKYAREE